jgi:group I intron endonuclease
MAKTVERVGWVYLLVNLLNGKEYVGQTVRGILNRFKDHVYAAFGKKCSTPLYRAMRRDGLENFAVYELWRGSESKLNAAEKRLIRQRKTFIDFGFGYNLTTGGGGFKMSAATRRAISRRQRKLFKLPEKLEWLSWMSKSSWALPGAKARRKRGPNVEALRVANVIAAIRTPRSRKRQSKSQKASYAADNTRVTRLSKSLKKFNAKHPEVRKKVGKQLRGTHPHSKNGKRALSEAAAAQWASEEGRAKKLASMVGKRRSAEGRANMSASATLAWKKHRKSLTAARRAQWTPERCEHMRQVKLGKVAPKNRRIKEAT